MTFPFMHIIYLDHIYPFYYTYPTLTFDSKFYIIASKYLCNTTRLVNRYEKPFLNNLLNNLE
jgi:hypothetical protein